MHYVRSLIKLCSGVAPPDLKKTNVLGVRCFCADYKEELGERRLCNTQLVICGG
jgi:hypothetical protein